MTRFDFNDQSVISMFQSGMLWRLIKDFMAKRGFIVTGSTASNGKWCTEETKEESDKSLPRGLCFSIVDFKEVADVRLLKVWD